MLLLKNDASYVGLKLSLIEEIEAHIHPQSQINLVDFLSTQSKKLKFQNIITTHSNSLASKVDLNNIIICKNGKAYSLKNDKTKLATGDYEFLRRFLDDTKSNLFFANGVIIVEGDAENLLIPALAEYIDIPLHKYGISIVNVGSTALLRYSKIFQRKDDQAIGIKVACITDRDIPPKEARDYTYQVKRRTTGQVENVSLLSNTRSTEDEYTAQDILDIYNKKVSKYRGGDVEVFIGKTWTLEYEIAKSVLGSLMHQAIELAIETRNGEIEISVSVYRSVLRRCQQASLAWTQAAKTPTEIAVEIYAPLERDQASKAVTAQIFSKLLLRSKIDKTQVLADADLKYLIDAIKHAANV